MDDINTNNSLRQLISTLHEIYQPIYGHPELAEAVSRPCNDRLVHISSIYQSLVAQLQRPLRVLDLGCAQGFFSLNLAELGATVHGVDYFDANIALCQALAAEHSDMEASFQAGRIEDVLQQLEPDQYDLVLGLSVFHHIVHEKGADTVRHILGELAGKVAAGIFELALAAEPPYWGPSQPQKPRQLLDGFAFTHEVARHETHLSSITRPLYFASNRYWFLDGQAGQFDTWQAESHSLAHDSYQGTRRYYISNDSIVKIQLLEYGILLQENIVNFQNEVDFLRLPTPGFVAPRLVLNGKHESETWLVRERVPGDLLLDVWRTGKPYDASRILKDVLSQLAVLESAGLYHSDVRVWNVLIHENGSAVLIDYGSILSSPKDCVWPHNIFLSFFIFLHELFSGRVDAPDPIRQPSIGPFSLPEAYRIPGLFFWSLPTNEWSFKRLRDIFLGVGFDALALSYIKDNSLRLALQTMEEATDLLRSHIAKKDRQLAAQCAEQERKIAEKDRQLAEKDMQKDRLLAEKDALLTEKDMQKDGQLAEKDRQIQELLNSYSWKVTAPLRGLLRFLKR